VSVHRWCLNVLARLFLNKGLGFIDIKKWQFTQCNLNLEKFICDTVGHVYLSRIIGTVKLSYDEVFYKQMLVLVWKFQWLVSQRNKMEVKVLGNFVVNCSTYTLTDSKLVVLNKGMSYAVSYPHSNLDMMCTLESLVLKLFPAKRMAFRWNITYVLDKCRNTSISLMELELWVPSSWRDNGIESR